jgi:hypothetical protein
LSERQLKELRNYAEQTGENPISYHIRQGITNTYNNKKESEKKVNGSDTKTGSLAEFKK